MAFILFFILILLSISAVSATNSTEDDTVALNDVDDGYLDAGDDMNAIYVDTHGKASNDGSQSKPLNSIKTAVSNAKENSTIYIANGEYMNTLNTRITVDKSLNFIGSGNTVINGQGRNYIFDICDGVTVTFKNIIFINAYKAPESYSVSYNNNVYGSVLDIKNATVLVDNCYFIDNVLTYGSRDNYIYGGAISNFGDLTIVNSGFINNTALSTSGLFSYGGSLYNKGRASICNSSFTDSKSVDFGYGAAIANDGELLMENSIISNSTALHECKGSAIYNTGDFKLFNSTVENNYIERANFNYIYGVIYNSGTLTACGSIFRNNTGYYDSMPSYKGSPNIYNIGSLNITYSVFMDNNEYDGISSDIYFNGGDVINLDNNWWNTNENPYLAGTKINVDVINSWLMFMLTPDYSKLNISDSITIKAVWTNNIDLLPHADLIPAFNVTFKTAANGKNITQSKELSGGSCDFIFDYTQSKGSYDVTVCLFSFNQTAIVDVGKILSYISFNLTDNLTYLDDLVVDVEVTGADGKIPTGVVLLKIADETYAVNLTDGKGTCTVSDLVPGNYNVNMVYDGDENYFKAFDNASFSVNKQDVDLGISIPEIKVGQKGQAIVSLAPKGVQGQAILYVDGVRKKIVYLYNGNTTISLSNFAEGEYNISLEFVETTFYNSAFVSGILNVTRYDSAINITAADVKRGENATITIKVSPDSLRGEATLIINGVNETIFIDNTVTNITITNLEGGEYYVTLIFDGDLRYYPVNVSTSFRVLKTPVELDVGVDFDEKNRNGTITVNTGYSNSTGVVGVYINYNLYKMNLTDGSAEFDVRFDKGTNYIYVFYEGDRYFEEATWNTTIGIDDKFVFMGQNATGYVGNDFNYSVRLIELTGIPMPNRNVTVKFNGKKYNITTDDNGYAYFKLNLASGTYEISATYRNATITNTLTVKSLEMDLNSSDITYGEDEIIKATFDGPINGTMTFVIGDLNVTADISNGTASYGLSGLDVGEYSIKAVYANDFIALTRTTTFNVEKSDLTLAVDVGSATPFTDEIIIVTGLKNATGNVTFLFNATKYMIPISDSQALLNLSKLNEGNYSIYVSYEGDNNYNAADKTVSFYVKEFSSDLILTVEDKAYAQYIIAEAVLNYNATGIVRFSIANITKDIEIVDGKAIWNFTGIDAGKYVVNAEYLGNEYYISSSNSTDLTISKANSTINVYVKEVALNENIRIYADLSPNATGNVLFSMIGYFSPRYKPITDSKSTWYIAPLNTGEYEVIAKYDGDKNYYSSETTYILNVSQKKSVLDVELNDVGLNDRVVCKVSLYSKDGDAITSKVTLRIGSSSYNINVRSGSGSLVLGKLAMGNYTYTVEYAGDENYTPAAYSGTFKVVDDLLDVNLTALNLTKYYSGNEELMITLKDSNNRPFADQDITVKINGKEYYLVTDDNGEASCPVDLDVGEYTAVISYDETERYHSASINASVVVLTTVEGIDVVKLFDSGTQYFAIYVDSKGKAISNKEVTFKIAGRSHTVKTLPNGIVRLNINIDAGTYTISSTNPATGQKLTNTITIYYKIMGNKDVSNYYGAKTNYKVRIYTDGGKAVGAGKVVTFKINKKTYKVKTDKNGYAKLAIKLNPKKYTVTASYGGFKVSNKITVKNLLSAKNISKKKSKVTKFSAKLVNSKGKVVKGKKVTFKIHGKKYTAKTNSKGKATAKIKMNLGVGKHKIQVSYGKCKLTKTITIKK